MIESKVVIYSAKLVRTMDPSVPSASAVAVRGDRILAVGTVEELSVYENSSVDERYAESVLLPGFVEAHSHIQSGSMWDFTYVGFYPRMSPDGHNWPGCTSTADLLERLRDAESKIEDPSALMVAWGFDPLFIDGERLDRRFLDTISNTRPILLLHQSNHALTVNSALIRLDGLEKSAGVEGVMLDKEGQLTGELREFAAMSLARSFGAIMGRPEFDEVGLRNFAADAQNHGVTTFVDLGSRSLMSDEAVEAFTSIVDSDTFPARLSIFHLAGFPSSPDSVFAVERLHELKQTSTAKMRFGHVKIILDGSIQGFTARLQEPGYLNSNRKGIWALPPETFSQVFTDFHRAGLTVHVHCNGDEATELFLDTVEAALAKYPRWDHRHTVTHSQLSTPAQYRRMAALKMCANLFINHIWYWGTQHAQFTVGPDRAARMNAAATALRAGVPISFHSDTPITPIDPLATVSIATTRTSSTGVLLGANERISVPEALHAVTLGAALMLKMDHEIGSIEPGKFADFAVLAEDPFEAKAEAVRDIEIFGTVVGGKHFPRGDSPDSSAN